MAFRPSSKAIEDFQAYSGGVDHRLPVEHSLLPQGSRRERLRTADSAAWSSLPNVRAEVFVAAVATEYATTSHVDKSQLLCGLSGAVSDNVCICENGCFCAEAGVAPNMWTFNALIKAHCHAGSLSDALKVRSRRCSITCHEVGYIWSIKPDIKPRPYSQLLNAPTLTISNRECRCRSHVSRRSQSSNFAPNQQSLHATANSR